MKKGKIIILLLLALSTSLGEKSYYELLGVNRKAKEK